MVGGLATLIAAAKVSQPHAWVYALRYRPRAAIAGLVVLALVTATLAEADASVGMVYLMHILGAATISAARPSATRALTPILQEIAAGRHLSTLAFSEAGSRSHFWAPISRAQRNGDGVRISAKKSWVTSAGHTQSYVVSALAPEGAGPTDSTLYLVAAGARGLSTSGARGGPDQLQADHEGP